MGFSWMFTKEVEVVEEIFNLVLAILLLGFHIGRSLEVTKFATNGKCW